MYRPHLTFLLNIAAGTTIALVCGERLLHRHNRPGYLLRVTGWLDGDPGEAAVWKEKESRGR